MSKLLSSFLTEIVNLNDGKFYINAASLTCIVALQELRNAMAVFALKTIT